MMNYLFLGWEERLITWKSREGKNLFNKSNED
jgi:hypothetical protein